jgi:hypothetical protein
MSDFIGFEVKGLKELQDKLKRLDDEAIGAGIEMANEYIVNYERTNQPTYTYVSIEQAGGFVSEKQRRFVMASLDDGTMQIPYKRTQDLANDWQVLGKGINQIVVNENPAAPWVKDIKTQSRMMFLRGWTVIQQDIQERMTEIIRKFDAGVKKAIKKIGL